MESVLEGWADVNEDELIPNKLVALQRISNSKRVKAEGGNRGKGRPRSRSSCRPSSRQRVHGKGLPQQNRLEKSESAPCIALRAKTAQVGLDNPRHQDVFRDHSYRPTLNGSTQLRKIHFGAKGSRSQQLVGRLRGPCFTSPALCISTVPSCKLKFAWRREEAEKKNQDGALLNELNHIVTPLNTKKTSWGRTRSSCGRRKKGKEKGGGNGKLSKVNAGLKGEGEALGRGPSTYSLGVYGEVLVWVDDRIVATEERFKHQGLAMQHDHISNEDCSVEIDPLEAFIRPKPVHTFQGKKSRIPPTLVHKNDLPRWDRPRPKGKHSVCLLLRISGLEAEEFGDADEGAIKELLCSSLYFVKFMTIEQYGETEERNIRNLHFDDISIYLKQNVANKLKPADSEVGWQRDSEKRMKLGVEIWVKPADTTKSAGSLCHLARKGKLREAIGQSCPSIVCANKRNLFIYEDRDTSSHGEERRLLGDAPRGREMELLTPLGFEYNPTAVMSTAGGMSMYNLTLRFEAGFEVNGAELRQAREELHERALECKLTKKQFEHDSLNAESTYKSAITRVHGSRDTLYEKLIEKGGLEDILDDT